MLDMLTSVLLDYSLPVDPGHQRLGRDGRWPGGAEQVTETSTACRPPCARWRHGSSHAAVTRMASPATSANELSTSTRALRTIPPAARHVIKP